MYRRHYQELVQSEAEKLADKMDLDYCDLSEELRESIHRLAIESLRLEEMIEGYVGTA
jgi:hypothetical protein